MASPYPPSPGTPMCPAAGPLTTRAAAMTAHHAHLGISRVGDPAVPRCPWPLLRVRQGPAWPLPPSTTAPGLPIAGAVLAQASPVWELSGVGERKREERRGEKRRDRHVGPGPTCRVKWKRIGHITLPQPEDVISVKRATGPAQFRSQPALFFFQKWEADS